MRKTKHIKFHQYLLDNYKNLDINFKEAFILQALFEVRKDIPTPFPKHLAHYLKHDEDEVKKIYMSLMEKTLITITKNELSLDGVVDLIEGRKILSVDTSAITSQALELLQSKCLHNITDKDVNWLESELISNGFEHFKKTINQNGCKGTIQDIVKFFNKSSPKTKTSPNISTVKWIDN